MLSISKPSTFTYAVALLVASTIGIGFYGIPYTFSHAGTGVGVAFLIILTASVMTTNLLYGEIILRTHERHQFVGYVRRYLGKWARVLSVFNFWVAMYGAVIGILIINGKFFSQVLEYFGYKVSPVTLSICVMTLVTILVYSGLRTVSHVDFGIMALVAAVVMIIVVAGLRRVELTNYVLSTHVSWFLPFGVILFSLNGYQGIPLVREVLGGKEHLYRRALIYGTLIPALIYLIFSLVVVGVAGKGTSPDGISSLAGHLGDSVVLLGSIIGFFTSGTIFLSVVTAFRTSLREDFVLRRRRDFILLLIPPFLMFLWGVRDFIKILSVVGGVAVSIDMILLLFMYARVREKGNRIPEYAMRIPNVAVYIMMGLFFLGAVYSLVA